jgi:hypothetical protein
MADRFVREVERKFERRGFLTDKEVAGLRNLKGKRDA